MGTIAFKHNLSARTHTCTLSAHTYTIHPTGLERVGVACRTTLNHIFTTQANLVFPLCTPGREDQRTVITESPGRRAGRSDSKFAQRFYFTAASLF